MTTPSTRPAPATRVTFSGSGGLRLVGETRGDAGATPIVFVHGSGQSRHSWAAAAAALAADGWRTVSYDLRGHGDSERAETGAYGLDDLCLDLSGVLDTLDRPAVLVGASMGGAIALLTAGTARRDDVGAIVLADGAHRVAETGGAGMRAFVRGACEGYTSLDEASQALAALGMSAQPPSPDRLRYVLRQEGGRYWWPWDPAFGVYWSSYDEDHAELVLAAARAADCPILLVRGAESPLLTPEIATEFCDQVPRARRIDLHGVGHMLTGDDNAVFVEATGPFLRDITAQP